MSQFSWESEVLDQVQTEQQPELQPEPQLELVEQSSFEPESQPVAEPIADPGALALSADDFSALEDRILRAVNLVRRERLARADAEERAMQAELRLAEQTPQIEQLQSELNTLRAERDHVRQRVERLLTQLDALEL